MCTCITFSVSIPLLKDIFPASGYYKLVCYEHSGACVSVVGGSIFREYAREWFRWVLR